MSRKVKTFKRLFLENADTVSEERTKKKDKPIPAMFEDTFVSVCGDIYATAKEKYTDRTLQFTAWMFANCISNGNKYCLLHVNKGNINNWKHIEYFYKFWKDNIYTKQQ